MDELWAVPHKQVSRTSVLQAFINKSPNTYVSRGSWQYAPNKLYWRKNKTDHIFIAAEWTGPNQATICPNPGPRFITLSKRVQANQQAILEPLAATLESRNVTVVREPRTAYELL